MLLQVIVAEQAIVEAYPGQIPGFNHDLQQTTVWFMLLGQVRKAGILANTISVQREKKVKMLLHVIVAEQASFEAYPGQVAGFLVTWPVYCGVTLRP